MTRFAVFALDCRSKEHPNGTVGVVATKEEADILRHMLLNFKHLCLFVEEYSEVEHSVLHPDAFDMLDATHYYAWEHPEWWVTDEYRKVINRACAILQPFGATGREHLVSPF
jgi:hypothetical protein